MLAFKNFLKANQSWCSVITRVVNPIHILSNPHSHFFACMKRKHTTWSCLFYISFLHQLKVFLTSFKPGTCSIHHGEIGVWWSWWSVVFLVSHLVRQALEPLTRTHSHSCVTNTPFFFSWTYYLTYSSASIFNIHIGRFRLKNGDDPWPCFNNDDDTCPAVPQHNLRILHCTCTT